MTGRNAPCPCGSGKKYKKCCANREQVSGSGSSLQAAIRMKGGVAYDPEDDVYRAVVHSWDNTECDGDPSEWLSAESYRSEDEAMSFYKRTIRPKLERLMREASRQDNRIETFVTRLE